MLLLRLAAVLVVAPAIVSGQSGRRVAPNFEGIWNSATTTLLERPAQFKDKPFFTKEEAAAWDRESARRNEEPPPGTRQTGTGTYNTVYREFGTRSVKTLRTSIITDPADGRIPALTPAAAEVRRRRLEGLKKFGLRVDEVGRSYASREIYQVEFGKGPIKVFLWSQMHGDEPTATSALIDMFTILQKNRDKEWVKSIEKAITIRAVPMLNPDGAEFYQRRNMQGIDINRDAQNLQTPEANLLKKLRDEWAPNIGFNLHNQNALTTAGRTNKQAAI